LFWYLKRNTTVMIAAIHPLTLIFIDSTCILSNSQAAMTAMAAAAAEQPQSSQQPWL
jgi:hypothetical protein